MELRDLLITPAFLLLIYGVAFLVRPYVTDEVNRAYYFPALTVKIFGAISLGLVYQYYYGSGDTFIYHTYGSRFIYNAFLDSPLDGIKLLFADSKNPGDVYQYASKIYLFGDSNSYTVIRLAGIFDLITFSAYSSTAALFAVLSFIGSWQFFLTFYKQFPHLHGRLAVAAFFIPSVFFWGSGILKDTVVLACLGIATYQIYLIFIERRFRLDNVLMLLLSLYLIFSIRKFVLQAYLPSVLLWLGMSQVYRIHSFIVRAMVVPFVVLMLMVSGYYTVEKIGEDDNRYALYNIAETSRVTAYDIRYWSGRFAGSGYSLGELDGSFESMIRLAPAAVNVSLFRPYLWEVNNILMLFSSLESLLLLVMVIYVIVHKRNNLLGGLATTNVLFAVSFALVFAFAIGVSTYNFGTLVRYKIPLLPFLATALVLLLDYRKSDRKFGQLDSTE